MVEQEFLDDNDPILNQIWDEIQQREAGEITQFEENRTLISGLEIIDLLFKQTRDETKAAEIGASNVYADSPPPLPETLERLEGLVKDCIADGVASGDLELTEGDLEQDFYACKFPVKAMFLLIKLRKILQTLDDSGILIHPGLRPLLEVPATKPPFLPAPPGTVWKDVAITITEDTQIRINVKEKSQLYHLEKFKAEVIPQPKMQEYLFLITHSGGIFTKEDIAPAAEPEQFKIYVGRLRKQLREVFGIQDDPLPFEKQAYRVQFSVSSQING